MLMLRMVLGCGRGAAELVSEAGAEPAAPRNVHYVLDDAPDTRARDTAAETGAEDTGTATPSQAQTYETTCTCSIDALRCTGDPGWVVDGSAPLQVTINGRCNPDFEENDCAWRAVARSIDFSETGAFDFSCVEIADMEPSDEETILRYTELKVFLKLGW